MPSFRPNSQCLLAALLCIAMSGCSSSGSGSSSAPPADDNTSPAPISTPGDTESESGTPTDPQTPDEEQPAPSPGAGEPVIPTTEASFTEVDQPDWSILMKEGTWRLLRNFDSLGTRERTLPDHPTFLGTHRDINEYFLFTVEMVSDGQIRTYDCGDSNGLTVSAGDFGARLTDAFTDDYLSEDSPPLCTTTINNRYFMAPDAMRVERYCGDEKVMAFELVRISNNIRFEVAKAVLNSATTGAISETSGACGGRMFVDSIIDPDYLDVVDAEFRDYGGYYRNWDVMIPYGERFLEIYLIASGDLTAQDLAVGQTWPLGSRSPDGPLIQLGIYERWPEESTEDVSDSISLRPHSGTLEIIALDEYFTTFKFDFVTSDGEAVSGSFTIDFGQQ